MEKKEVGKVRRSAGWKSMAQRAWGIAGRRKERIWEVEKFGN
jgi:hypothetical protein